MPAGPACLPACPAGARSPSLLMVLLWADHSMLRHTIPAPPALLRSGNRRRRKRWHHRAGDWLGRGAAAGASGGGVCLAGLPPLTPPRLCPSFDHPRLLLALLRCWETGWDFLHPAGALWLAWR